MFNNSSNSIHSNFVGCTSSSLTGSGAGPFYSGFETYCYIARGNLRHFFGLCFKALSRADEPDVNFETVISVETQAEAARQVSADLLPEIRSFGPQGNNLHTFVLRLGSLLPLSTKSITERARADNFAIRGGEPELDEPAPYFWQNQKWSVLFEVKGTKKKNATEAEGVEYILNPIYSPYFHIAIRTSQA